ncbi:MAG TPA: DUF4843 domain-containing protein [Chitinophagaceae bacterium]|nr:DUF4843 domain-containing protein [Chitinophagaceae bacterium]
MKKGIVYTILFACMLPFIGCKEDVPTLFAEPDGIYFSASSDSVSYTFAKYPNRTKDTLRLPVTVLGKPAGTNRTITVEKVTANDVNGVEGVHYKLLGPYTMSANKVSTTIPVVIYRTPDMDSLTITFVLQLKANESFQSGISSKTSLKIKVGYLQKPPTWGEYISTQWWAGYRDNFGTWTKTKYKLILDALYDPVSDTTVTEFPYGALGVPPTSYPQYRQIVKNYIRTNYPGNYPPYVGASLKDPDQNNNPIQVGPANY